MSEQGDVANDAASDGGDIGERRGSSGQTAVVTKPATRPQRPTGKRSRQRVGETGEDLDVESSAEAGVSKKDSAEKVISKAGKDETAPKSKKSKKAKKTGPSKTRPANPIMFFYNYLKQVVAEIRKVIWPSRKQMIAYTSVVLAFLACMVTLVGLADMGLAKLMLLVFS